MTSRAPLSLTGSCHCGRVSVKLRTSSKTLPAARACGCSFCTKHGAAWTSDPQGELVLSHRAPDDIRRYRFGLGITDFIICAHCGVPCVAMGMVDDRLLGVVNINTASAEQLTFLPRVGPALAGRIVEFRDSNGKFKATDELILVRGIGEGTYELLKPYVTIDGKTTLTEPGSPG